MKVLLFICDRICWVIQNNDNKKRETEEHEERKRNERSMTR